jgi:transposase, IS30 family
MLMLADREEISRGLAKSLLYKEIAILIGRSVSVVSREVARHGGREGYRATDADRAARVGRARAKRFAVERDAGLRAEVMRLLKLGWSPASIAGRLPAEYPDRDAWRVSHEAIYQWVYAQPVAGLRAELIALRSGRTRRRGPKPAPAPRIREPRYLDERPSRFLVLVPLSGRDSLTVKDAIIAAVGDLPTSIKRSLTWDCGAEMALHKEVTATGLPVYFAHPHSPRERGSNENLNRIVREYFPKGTAITSDPHYLAAVAAEINDRPRKIHHWRKPSEIFTELLASDASTA